MNEAQANRKLDMLKLKRFVDKQIKKLEQEQISNLELFNEPENKIKSLNKIAQLKINALNDLRGHFRLMLGSQQLVLSYQEVVKYNDQQSSRYERLSHSEDETEAYESFKVRHYLDWIYSQKILPGKFEYDPDEPRTKFLNQLLMMISECEVTKELIGYERHAVEDERKLLNEERIKINTIKDVFERAQNIL